jgi:hypothetical protein
MVADLDAYLEEDEGAGERLDPGNSLVAVSRTRIVPRRPSPELLG